MRIFCWNVNSLVPTVRNINLKYGSLEAFFKQLDADIICMQEVKLPAAKLTKDLVMVPGYQSYWACSEGKTGYSGVTTWAREACAAVTAEADPLVCEGVEQEGRCIVTDHGSFVLFNVYVPNAGDRPSRARLPAKLAFLRALKEGIDEHLGAGRQVIAVGDFNVAAAQRDVHSAISWDTLYEASELQALHYVMDSVVDVWRHCHPETDGIYTVWNERTSARAFNVGLRIDYALCSKPLLQHVTSCEVLLDLPPKWSDHAPIMLELDLPAAAAGDRSQQQQQQQSVSCPMWRQLLKRFADPSQRSIASMFRARNTTGARLSKPVPVAAAAAAAASGGSCATVTDAEPGQRHSHEPDTAAAAAEGSSAATPSAAQAVAEQGSAAAAAAAEQGSAAAAAAAAGGVGNDDNAVLPPAKRLRGEPVTIDEHDDKHGADDGVLAGSTDAADVAAAATAAAAAAAAGAEHMMGSSSGGSIPAATAVQQQPCQEQQPQPGQEQQQQPGQEQQQQQHNAKQHQMQHPDQEQQQQQQPDAMQQEPIAASATRQLRKGLAVPSKSSKASRGKLQQPPAAPASSNGRSAAAAAGTKQLQKQQSGPKQASLHTFLTKHSLS